MNAKIDKFFTQRILNEFRMTEEDAVGVKEIIRRFLIFEAKETVEELEKEDMPRAKRPSLRQEKTRCQVHRNRPRHQHEAFR